MQIIGGIHRSRKLHAPPERAMARPITVRLRQSLFDALEAREAIGDHVIDLFAGTGTLGLESISRGAGHVTFVENQRASVRMLQKNLEMLRETERGTVLSANALAGDWTHMLPMAERGAASLVFCDPPFPVPANPKGRDQLCELLGYLRPHLTDDAWVLLRYETGNPACEPPGYEPVHRTGAGRSVIDWFVPI